MFVGVRHEELVSAKLCCELVGCGGTNRVPFKGLVIGEGGLLIQKREEAASCEHVGEVPFEDGEAVVALADPQCVHQFGGGPSIDAAKGLAFGAVGVDGLR